MERKKNVQLQEDHPWDCINICTGTGTGTGTGTSTGTYTRNSQ